MKEILYIIIISFFIKFNSYGQWTQQNAPKLNKSYDLNSVYFVNKNIGWAAGSNGVIIHTNNGGINWDFQSSGIGSKINKIFFIDSVYGFCDGVNGIILKTTNGGVIWDTSYVYHLSEYELDVQYFSIFFTDSSNGWAGGEYWEQDYLEPQTLLSYTTNGGKDWETINGGSGGFGGNRINDVFFLDKNYGLLATQYVGGYGYIYKTLDGGKSWNDITPDSLINNSNKEYFYSNASFLSIQFINKEFGWVVGYAETFGLGIGGFIFKTEDGGITWRDQTENHLLGYLDVKFNDSFNGWILGNSTYNDSSIISQYKIGSMPIIAELKVKNDLHVSIRTKNINHKIIKSEDKFFYSGYLKKIDLNTPNISNHLLNTADGGQTWNVTNFDSIINAITFTDRYDGWAVGNNSAIYKYTLNTFIPFTKTLSVKEFTLYQNYPNPFNPFTTIKYALPYESSVDVTIYNMIGQRIEDFNEGIKEAGYHDVTWQPKNLSSGVYFYSINARSIDGKNDYSKTLKMLYMK